MTPQEIEQYVDACAAALGLPIAAEHRPGVLMYFGLAAGLAGLVQGLPLGVADDPAEAFVPIGPDDLAGDLAGGIAGESTGSGA